MSLFCTEIKAILDNISRELCSCLHFVWGYDLQCKDSVCSAKEKFSGFCFTEGQIRSYMFNF